MATKTVCDLCGKDTDDVYFTLPHFLCAKRGDDTVILKTDTVGTGKFQLCKSCQYVIAMLIDRIQCNAKEENAISQKQFNIEDCHYTL